MRRFVFAATLLAASCGPSPISPGAAPGGTTPTEASASAPTHPFALTVTPDTLFVGVGRQSGQLDGIVVPNNGFWRMEVRATGTPYGTIKHIEQVLRDRQSGATRGVKVESGPLLANGNTPLRVYDPLKMYGAQAFSYNLDLGFDGHPSDLTTKVTVEDTLGSTWTLEHTMRWELLPPPTPKSPVNVVVRQNNADSGCAFDPVHGYGIVLSLSWDAPPATVPVTNYNFSVFDGRGKDLLNELLFPTERTFRIVRCGVHVSTGAERGARFGVRTHHAPSFGMSAYAVARFDFQSCRDAGVPACQ